METRILLNGMLLAAIGAAPVVASAQQCPPAPPPGSIERLNIEAHRVRPGESLSSVVARALRTRAIKAGTDPETLRRVTNAIGNKEPEQTDAEAAYAAMGFVVPAGIIAGGACVLATMACIEDVQEFHDACLEQTCPSGTRLDVDKCGRIVASDLQNCNITCGVNGPDGDAGRACVEVSGGPGPGPVGPFIPPTPIPPPFGGLSVECSEQEVQECEIQSGTYTDTETGNTVDRDCTLYDMSGDLSRCTCSCVEVVAVSEEVVFESTP